MDSHICWCKKRKNGGVELHNTGVCVCVLWDSSVTAAKSFLRLLVACVTTGPMMHLREDFTLLYTTTDTFSCMCVLKISFTLLFDHAMILLL